MSNNKGALALHAHTVGQAPTDSEARLWRALRSSQLGAAFRQRVPLLGFIADFYAPSARLAVEVDGGYHARRVTADARRDGKLAHAGLRIVRVQAELIMRDLPAEVSPLRRALDERRLRTKQSRAVYRNVEPRCPRSAEGKVELPPRAAEGARTQGQRELQGDAEGRATTSGTHQASVGWSLRAAVAEITSASIAPAPLSECALDAYFVQAAHAARSRKVRDKTLVVLCGGGPGGPNGN